MSIVSCAFVTTNTISGNAAFELRADASYQEPNILEIQITPITPTTSVVGFGKPAAPGAYPTTITEGAQDDMALPNTTVSIATAWTTGSSSPTNFMRRSTIANTTAIFTFARGLIVPAGNTVVLWNLATNDTFNISLIYDE